MFKFTKKFFLITLIIGFGFFFWFNSDKSKESIQKKLEDIASTPFTSKNYVDFKFKNEEFRAVWFKVDNPNNLRLLSNFEEQLTLEQIIEKWDCKDVSNGGFYDEDNSPIGLFISEEKVLRNSTKNVLFNGYFNISKNGDVSIGSTYSDSLRIGLQTGPILIKNKTIQKLNLQSDKTARRTIVGLTEENKIYFIIIFDKESVFQGPFLVDLPEIIENIQNKIGIELTDAINLDGGSASAFYTEGKKLSELTSVGSFFCVETKR